ncbi:hypothetical protein ABT142_18555 [Streptomyces sp. NPDC001857]
MTSRVPEQPTDTRSILVPAVIGALIIVLTEQPGHWGTLDRDGPP